MKAAHADCPQDVRRICLQRWFRADAQGRVKANWFSGRLELADPTSVTDGYGTDYIWQWQPTVRQGVLTTPELPADTYYWRALPRPEINQIYCGLLKLLNPPESREFNAYHLYGSRVWLKIEPTTADPVVSVVAADNPDVIPNALRIMKEYLTQHPLTGAAATTTCTIPVAFDSNWSCETE